MARDPMRTCTVCRRSLRPGDLVVPIMAVVNSTRYDPAPALQPALYAHLAHLQNSEATPAPVHPATPNERHDHEETHRQ